MPITSSTFTVDSQAQKDGRKYVYERHVVNTGEVLTPSYLAAAGADYTAIMNARVARLNEQLADSEFEATLNGP